MISRVPIKINIRRRPNQEVKAAIMEVEIKPDCRECEEDHSKIVDKAKIGLVVR